MKSPIPHARKTKPNSERRFNVSWLETTYPVIPGRESSKRNVPKTTEKVPIIVFLMAN